MGCLLMQSGDTFLQIPVERIIDSVSFFLQKPFKQNETHIASDNLIKMDLRQKNCIYRSG